jgi:hypothetical protein
VRERTRSLFTFLCLMFLHLQWLLPIFFSSFPLWLAVKCCIKGFPLTFFSRLKEVHTSEFVSLDKSQKEDGNFFPLNFFFTFFRIKKSFRQFLSSMRKKIPFYYFISVWTSFFSLMLNGRKLKEENFARRARKVFNWIRL